MPESSTKSWNVLVQNIVEVNLFPCINDLNLANPPTSKWRTHKIVCSEERSDGSLDTTFGTETPFKVVGSNGKGWGTGRVFKGVEYMPTEEHGSVTGTMICQNWDEWRALFCIKPEDNRTTRYVRQHKAGIGLWNIRQGW
jgi:hypothetical protein